MEDQQGKIIICNEIESAREKMESDLKKNFIEIRKRIFFIVAY